jgi:uncharacterized protein (TIGR00299 family) protein
LRESSGLFPCYTRKRQTMIPLIYFDCVGGVSGDMILASLLSLGVSSQELAQKLSVLPIKGYRLRTWKEKRMSLEGLRLAVEVDEEQRPRPYGKIKEMISESSLPERVRVQSLDVFSRLAEAESVVHGLPKEQVHFHEIGGVDSIVDIVGALTALHLLNIEEVYASPLPLGSGTVESLHGILPLPAPATLQLLKGVPVYGVGLEGETVTPTGAALLVSLVKKFGPLPSFIPEGVGCGLGLKEWPDRPNMVRAVLGKTGEGPAQEVTVIECTIDDMNPELYGPLLEKLLDRGALDAALVPVYMKKNRPGTQIQVLCAPEDRHKIMETILSETTTIGVRYYTASRYTLPRESVVMDTPLGPVQVKRVVRPNGKVVHYPEFEACKKLSEKTGLPLIEVYRIVERQLVEA